MSEIEELEEVEAELRSVLKIANRLDEKLRDAEEKVPEENEQKFDELCDQFGLTMEEIGNALSVAEHLNAGVRE